MIRRSVRFVSPVAGRGAVAVALLLTASAAAAEGAAAAPHASTEVAQGAGAEAAPAAPVTNAETRGVADGAPRAPAVSDPTASSGPTAGADPVATSPGAAQPGPTPEVAQPGAAATEAAQPGPKTSEAAQPGVPASDPAQPVGALSEPTPAAAAQRAEPIRLEPARASLLPLAQPLWSDLTTVQQQVLAPFEAQWNALPLTEKRAWADLARRFPQLKTDAQARVQKRVAEWARLTPEQRRVARNNYRLAQQVARENVLAEWERYQAMTPEQRNVLNAAGSTSNTAARHVAAPNGLAKVAAQPLPRGTPRTQATLTVGTDGGGKPAAGVAPTVGPAPGNGAGTAR
jgi:hypothetical protein